MLKIAIGSKKFKVKVMKDPKSQGVGMMYKNFDENFNGMFFLMNKDDNCFWMKNCIIPLDIIFIKNNVIVNIHHNCPPCKVENCPSYCGRGNAVLEVLGGTCLKYNIQPGDTLNYL